MTPPGRGGGIFKNPRGGRLFFFGGPGARCVPDGGAVPSSICVRKYESAPTYQDRIRAQIAQYAETVNMHDLPEAFHIWSHKCIGSALNEVFGTYSIDEVYALAYIEARQREAGDGRILSIGCGDGGVETESRRSCWSAASMISCSSAPTSRRSSWVT